MASASFSIFGIAGLLALAATGASAQTAAPPAPAAPSGLLPITLDITVGGTSAVIGIDAAGLPLARDAELLLDFDAAQNLCLDSLGVSAAIVNVADPAFRARLPEGAMLPLALPLLIRVEPPPTSSCGALSFTDTVRAEIHTHLLPFSVDSPLRLYKAPLGGRFVDITAGVAPGSVRTSGRTGGFSEFIVAIDLLPIPPAAGAQYDYLEARVANPAIAPALAAQLSADLAASRDAFDAADYASAIVALGTFDSRVRAASPADLPDTWRAQRDLDNIAGDLLGRSASLAYLLGRL
jgi:hypothetical protein